MGREVSESCVDGLLTEMFSTYCNRFYANKPELAARRIEAIGYQVGNQLSERQHTLFSMLMSVEPDELQPAHLGEAMLICQRS
ncbi:hypothetical protein QYF36_011810 [Acer negundo]|nr:hypothetical protein QYF36_011810 [Acer negundo]